MKALAELPLHRHLLTRDRGRDAIRELDEFLTDSRRTSSTCVRGTFDPSSAALFNDHGITRNAAFAAHGL